MPIDSWVGFFLTVLLIIAIPGPSSLNQTRIGLNHNTLDGFYASLGGITATNCYLAISFLMTTNVISFLVPESLLTALKLFGCMFIVYLGFSTYRSDFDMSHVDDPDSLVKPFDMYKNGFLVAASNPKDILFWFAMMPAFVTTGDFKEWLIIALTWTVVDITAMTSYSALANWSVRNFSKIKVIATKLTGSGLMFLGCCGLAFTLRDSL